MAFTIVASTKDGTSQTTLGATYQATARATAASYDLRTRRVVVELDTGFAIAFRPCDIDAMQATTPEQLSVIAVSPSGRVLHFARLDVDVFLSSLLKALLGKSDVGTVSVVGRKPIKRLAKPPEGSPQAQP